MNFARFVVIVTGLIFTSYGIACLIDPSLPAGYMGVKLGNAGGRVEFMAMYGGLQAGFGLLLLYMGWQTPLVAAGLKLVIVIIGSLAVSRITGLIIYGTDDYNIGAVIFESTTTVLAILALMMKR